MADLAAYMASHCELIEKQLDQLMPEKDVPYRTLFHAARYSLLGGGKRLRPILTLATTETLGGNVKKALIPACAVEMIHTYSLIHDDLPCMDNDDFRRGKPSLHKAFLEGHAVLTGDFLLTNAFDVLAHDAQLTAEQKITLISILSRKSGGEGMIGGQVMDLEAEGKQIDLAALRCIHRNKTGALLTASIEFGAVVAGASDAHMDVLRQFGEEIGLAFQIIDDVLDVTASGQKHGKATASDITNQKTTYVSLLGLEQAQALAHQLFQSAVSQLKQLPYDITLLTRLAELVVCRKG